MRDHLRAKEEEIGSEDIGKYWLSWIVSPPRIPKLGIKFSTLTYTKRKQNEDYYAEVVAKVTDEIKLKNLSLDILGIEEEKEVKIENHSTLLYVYTIKNSTKINTSDLTNNNYLSKTYLFEKEDLYSGNPFFYISVNILFQKNGELFEEIHLDNKNYKFFKKNSIKLKKINSKEELIKKVISSYKKIDFDFEKELVEENIQEKIINMFEEKNYFFTNYSFGEDSLYEGEPLYFEGKFNYRDIKNNEIENYFFLIPIIKTFLPFGNKENVSSLILIRFGLEYTLF